MKFKNKEVALALCRTTHSRLLDVREDINVLLRVRMKPPRCMDKGSRSGK